MGPYNPKALSQLLIHPQEQFHALQMVIDIERNIASSSPLSVLPKDPVSFHSNTPVIRAITPHVYDANKIIPLQASTHLELLLFIPYAVCICMEAFKLGPWWNWLTAGMGEIAFRSPSWAERDAQAVPSGYEKEFLSTSFTFYFLNLSGKKKKRL